MAKVKKIAAKRAKASRARRVPARKPLASTPRPSKAAPPQMKKELPPPKKGKAAKLKETPAAQAPRLKRAAGVEKVLPRRPLTPELLQIRGRLQAMLTERRQDIDQEVRGASARDLAHINDSSDMASDAADGDLSLRIAESETVEASEIERAIEKVDNGTYGLCEVCTKPINAERLQFLPYVTMCIKCQSLAEIRKRERSDELDDLTAEAPEADTENN